MEEAAGEAPSSSSKLLIFQQSSSMKKCKAIGHSVDHTSIIFGQFSVS
jgi:hypothetical protein